MFSGFLVNTWVVASIVAAAAGFVGFFVVIRGASFAAHALPLGAFPGAAAARLFGFNELLGLIAFSGLGVIGISGLGRRGRHEVATALSLVALLGLGALFLSMSREYSQEVYSLLFGQVLGISASEVAPIAVISAVAIALTAARFRPLLLNATSPELGEAMGVTRNGAELFFLIIVALASAMAVTVVGTLLVFSLMVGPAAAARSLTNHPILASLLSVILSLVTVWAAIALSYWTDWPIGFFVGGIAALCYGTGRVLTRASPLL
jgi:zinc/manganese transport system permease protein